MRVYLSVELDHLTEVQYSIGVSGGEDAYAEALRAVDRAAIDARAWIRQQNEEASRREEASGG